METFLQYAVLFVFLVWILATVALQVPRVRDWVQQRDVNLLIPDYRFFAPVPAQGDFHLLFRDTYANGTVSRWTEVCPPGDRRLSQALWHPDKRQHKAVFDVVIQLNKIRLQGTTDRLIQLSIPYLLILNYISSLPRTPKAELTEFMIVASHGWFSKRQPDTIHRSGLHRLPAQRSQREGQFPRAFARLPSGPPL